MGDKNHPEPENDLNGCRSKISERKQSIVINLLAILDKSTRSPSNSSSSSNEDNVSFADVGEDISQNLFLYTPYCYFFQRARAGHHQQIVNPLKVPHLMMKRSL